MQRCLSREPEWGTGQRESIIFEALNNMRRGPGWMKIDGDLELFCNFK
jgi:hypothetical protein